MKKNILSLILIISVTVTGNEDLLIRQVVPEQEQQQEPTTTDHHHFTLFKTKFKRTYATQEEHDYRFTVFKANVCRAKRHQILDPTAKHGVTKFSDLIPADANKAPILPTSDLPEEFDSREKGAVTPCM